MADSKKYDGSTWEHSLRKLATATDTFTTLPVDIYADGNNATVGLKGNTVQSGTPTPSSPVDVQGCGERTNNLLRLYKDDYALDENGNEVVNSDFCIYEATVEISSLNYILTGGTQYGRNIRVHEYTGSTWVRQIYVGLATTLPFNLTKSSGTNVIRVSAYKLIPNMMLAYGSTALPYEPYGYKIPILSAGQTTSLYLGEVQSARKIKKLVLTGEEDISINTNFRFVIYIDDIIKASAGRTKQSYCSHYECLYHSEPYDDEWNNVYYQNGGTLYFHDRRFTTVTDFKSYLAAQYAAGTPVTIWYASEGETTGIVNEPLMRIGNYADTVSGITIPTITGKDTFDVETTLKPSEASLSYTGWHDATVKEWDGSQWNE